MRSILLLFASLARADEAIDLGELGAGQFSPYVLERDPLWVLLPVFMIAVVLVHLKKHKRPVLLSSEEKVDEEADKNHSDRSNVVSIRRE